MHFKKINYMAKNSKAGFHMSKNYNHITSFQGFFGTLNSLKHENFIHKLRN